MDCKLQKVIFITHPLLIKTLLDTEHRGNTSPINGGCFFKGVQATIGNNNVFTADRDTHTKLRTLFLEPLKPSNLPMYYSEMMNMCKDLFTSLEQKQTFNPHPVLKSFTLDLFLKILLGFNNEDKDLYNNFSQLIEVLGKLTRQIPVKELDSAIRLSIQQSIGKMIQGSSSSSEPNYLTSLHQLKNQDKITQSQLEEMIYVILGAGMETTASTMNSILYCLGQHPEWQIMLRNELASLDGEPSYADKLKKSPQLDRFIKEVFRLYPPIWGQGRHVASDFTLGHFSFEKDSVILLMYLFSQRDPSRWTDPLKFDPNRFNPEFEQEYPLKDPQNLFHFSYGKGDCLGRFFALHLIKLFVWTLLENYQVKSLNVKALSKEGSLAMYIDNVNLQLTPLKVSSKTTQVEIRV